MAKMLHVVGDSKFGGGSIIVLRLAEAARQRGWGVHVLATDPVFVQALWNAGVEVVDLNVIWREINPVRDTVGCYRLYRFLRHNRYDVVHTHTSKAGFVGRLAACQARIPVVIHTVHGFAFHEQSRPLALKSYALLERLASHWCDRIVTVSEFHRKWALDLGIGNEQKVVAIPNGIAESRVSPSKSAADIRSELGLQSDNAAILATGRLAPQKGFEYLIQAAAILCTRYSRPFRILLAGEGPMRPLLQAQARKLGVADRVVFLGFRSDVGDLLAAADLVVLPSLREGLSIALLEAMAAGKAIVTTTIGSNREVVQHGATALLVPSKDPDALAEAITQLMQNAELRHRLGVAARERYREHYTEERMVQAYMQLYMDLYSSKHMINQDIDSGATA